jgi:quercetin dioxygenase-like cupin family protein
MRLTARDSVNAVVMLPGVTRRTLNEGSLTMLCEIELARGSVVPLHTHPHEQIGYLSRGRLLFVIGDELRELQAGDSWCVPGDVPHGVTALEDSIAIDIFAPPRDEYR